MIALRDYQQAAVDALRHSLGLGNRSPLLVAPCGSGKTVVASAVMQSAVAKGSPVLFLAPRRELVHQTVKVLQGFGVNAGIIMAGERRSLVADVQVACVPTMHRRVIERGDTPPSAKLIVVDEAHATFSNMARAVLKRYPGVCVVGMTATPARSDGRGLGEIYDDLVPGPSVAELTAAGHLVPVRYFAPSKPDLERVRMQAGDYHVGDLGQQMNQPQLIGDVVQNWQRICPERRTVVFAVNRAHAMALHQAFTDAGVVSEYLDGKTKNDERAAILGRIESGETRVLCSVDVLSYGWDAPPVSCAIIARPTKSIARYLQAAGRVLRPYQGKADCILIDHSGVVENLGFLDDEQPWSLDGKERIQDRKAASERKEPKPITCPQCKAMMEPAPVCPNCGADLRYQRAHAIKAHEAELQEVARKQQASQARQWTMDDKRGFYAELLGYSRNHGYRDGWAAHKFREKLGVWPRVGDVQPATPGEFTMGWIRHCQIKNAKRRRAA